jgi:glycosyltransferase involved in cell wall biosynthesis
VRIAIISTCAVAAPPKDYGGTELVVAELAKTLVRRGHDVTVFATGDSKPGAKLEFRFPTPVWPPRELAELRHALFAWREVANGGFDIVHAHQAQALALGALAAETPVVMTIHHCRDEELLEFYRDTPEANFVAISRRQAELVPELGPRFVVHHGLDPSRYAAGRGRGGYCAFLGRFAAEKGPHDAIDAALEAGVSLRMGGAPHAPDQTYFDAEVLPRLARAKKKVTRLGPVGWRAKVDLLGGARALLFPIHWEEPFGLVMIESMLVGTPVLAFARGSVAEVVEDGVTGFVVDDVHGMAARLRRLDDFDRERCRARAIERWGAARMAADYERVYEEVLRRGSRMREIQSSGEYARPDVVEEPWANQK